MTERGQVSRRDLTALLGAALAFGAPAGAMEVYHPRQSSRLIPTAPQAYTPPDTLSAVRDLYRRMTVGVRINGQGPFQFVVDSGSNRTVISRDLAARIGLAEGEAVEVNGVAGERMAPTAMARLDVGARRFGDVQLLLLAHDDLGADGLLGLDDLDGQAVTLDFRRQQLKIESPAHLAWDPDAVVLRAYRRGGQLLLVDADLDRQKVIAFLDTGSDNTIGNLMLRAKTGAGEINHPFFTAPIESATGQSVDSRISQLPRLRLGSMTIPSWPVAFADLHTFHMWDLTEEPAMLLGVDVLSRFDYVCLDFARNQVRFRMPSVG